MENLDSSIDNLRCSAGSAGLSEDLEHGFKEPDELWPFLFYGAQTGSRQIVYETEIRLFR